MPPRVHTLCGPSHTDSGLGYVTCFVHGMWDLPGITPMPPVVEVLEMQSRNHWTTREVPFIFLYSSE